MDADSLKEAVRKIRGGEAVPGLSLEGDLLTDGTKAWKVQGHERLRLTEVPLATEAPAGAPEPAEDQGDPLPRKRRAVREPAADAWVECSKCGGEFVRSRFNPYLTECPACRGKGRRRSDSEDRQFTCPRCGAGFTVSRFQPYHRPEACQACVRKAARRRYLDRKRALKGQAQQEP